MIKQTLRRKLSFYPDWQFSPVRRCILIDAVLAVVLWCPSDKTTRKLGTLGQTRGTRRDVLSVK